MTHNTDNSGNAWTTWSGTALVVYWLLMFVGMHLPPQWLPLMSFSDGSNVMNHGGDKLIHLIAYARLAVLFYVRVTSVSNRSAIHPFLLTGCVLAFYAILDELLQIPVGRNADVLDWLADLSGVAAGLVACVTLRLLIGTSDRSELAVESEVA